MAWADCIAYPEREAMREPDRGISEKLSFPRLFRILQVNMIGLVPGILQGIHKNVKLWKKKRKRKISSHAGISSRRLQKGRCLFWGPSRCRKFPCCRMPLMWMIPWGAITVARRVVKEVAVGFVQLVARILAVAVVMVGVKCHARGLVGVRVQLRVKEGVGIPALACRISE